MSPSQSFGIRSLKLSNAELDNIATQIVDHAHIGVGARVVITLSSHVFLKAVNDAAFRDVIQRAEYVIPDGISICLAVKILENHSVPRIPGVDLLASICEHADPLRLKIMLIGGRPGAAEKTISVFEKNFPNLIFQAFCPPIGFEQSPVTLSRALDAIRSFAPHIAFVALGVPKQEFFMEQRLRPMHIPIMVNVGGSFEMISGMTPRAPLWVRKVWMEWIFRLLQEPRRLFMRYLTTNTVFCWLVFREWLSGL